MKLVELLARLVQTGITQPWKKKIAAEAVHPIPGMKKPTASQVTANLKIVQKQDEGKEKYAGILEAYIRHPKQNGHVMETIPSTTMTHMYGTEEFR